jgi:glycosyltransferase involved in cell wall biosynthesis
VKKLRILILNHEFPPIGAGASAGTYEIAKGYAERGHHVSVVTMHYKGLSRAECKDGIQIYRVPCVRRSNDRCTVPEMLTYIVSARHFLTDHFRTHRYDINHSQFILPAGSIALWAKRKYSLPYVLTSRGSDVLGHNPRFRWVYPVVAHTWRAILAEAKAVTCASAYLAETIQRSQPNLNIVTVPSAVDPQWFRSLPKENRILVVARLIPLKGIQDLLEALARVNLDGWNVDIVGDGTYRSALEHKTARYGLQKHVTFHGWIDNRSERLRELYGRARIFVSPSHRENLSMSVLEALAARCWVVASDAGGTPEVLDDGSLFERRNIAALTKKLAGAMVASCTRPGPPLAPRFRCEQVVPQYEDLCYS